ncbi:hypothetical protein GCM10023080_074020 [Streptomyces pseudoechinosporeus]
MITALAFAVAGLGSNGIVLIALAAILINMAVQTTLMLGQHTIHQSYPAAGSQLGSVLHHVGGCTGPTVLGAAMPLAALLYWASERRSR